HTHASLAALILRLMRLQRAIEKDPAAKNYTDVALTPVTDDEDESLDLLTKTTGAREAVAHLRKVAGLTARTA
ncbi:MAG TPA: hypothetical protein VLW75_01465, partial [Rhizomicrobium sp.]|nr:hypothetical protein [Rhizomicrobium sp.]